MWHVRLDRRAERQFERLGAADQQRVRVFIDERLAGLPTPRAAGAPLTGRFAGLWKYRVGDIRIVADIRDRELLILVVQISNRREVYR